VKVIYETVGVPLKYFPLLAICGLRAGPAFGLVVGIWLPALGVAGAIVLVVYFVGAVVSHLRASATSKALGRRLHARARAAALALRLVTMPSV